MFNESTALAISADHEINQAVQDVPSLTFDRKALLAAVVTICDVVARRTTIPILHNMRIVSDANGTRLTGTDLDVETVVNVPHLDEWRDFSTTIPAHALKDVLRKSKADRVTLKLVEPHVITWTDDVDENEKPIKRMTETGGKLEISYSSGGSMVVQALPPSDFPDLKFRDTETQTQAFTFQADAKELTEALARTAYAISTEETRYYLHGVFMHYRSTDLNGISGLCFTATDGHRLAHRSVAALVPTELPGSIVPHNTVLHLVKALGKSPVGKVKITVTTEKIRFSFGETVITSKLIDGTFPDYERVIPRENPHRVTINKAALAAAVQQVIMVTPEKMRAVKFEFEAGRVNLTVNNPETGTATASLPCETPPEFVMQVGFNGRYVIDICENLKGETLVLEIRDARSPCVIRSADEPRALAVLMPMRV